MLGTICLVSLPPIRTLTSLFKSFKSSILFTANCNELFGFFFPNCFCQQTLLHGLWLEILCGRELFQFHYHFLNCFRQQNYWKRRCWRTFVAQNFLDTPPFIDCFFRPETCFRICLPMSCHMLGMTILDRSPFLLIDSNCQLTLSLNHLAVETIPFCLCSIKRIYQFNWVRFIWRSSIHLITLIQVYQMQVECL